MGFHSFVYYQICELVCNINFSNNKIQENLIFDLLHFCYVSSKEQLDQISENYCKIPCKCLKQSCWSDVGFQASILVERRKIFSCCWLLLFFLGRAMTSEEEYKINETKRRQVSRVCCNLQRLLLFEIIVKLYLYLHYLYLWWDRVKFSDLKI
jgi:hypothetical protein